MIHASHVTDVDRAVAAYRASRLQTEKFASITQDGKRYVIAGGTRLGLVPHRDGVVISPR